MTLAAAASALLWLALLCVPWKPWRAEPRFDADPARASDPLHNVTALIPARDEAAALPQSLAALSAGDTGLRVVVVDDQSTDGSGEIARAAGADVVGGTAVPAGWSGKVWALEQGLARVDSEYVLLLDADIALEPGTVATLLAKARSERLAFVSIVPQPRLAGLWERLLMPAFVYFFALLYPFRLSNRRTSRIAAASGGCVLVERGALAAIGGFASLKGALIDDCTLAANVKRAGFTTWIGLTRSARGLRSYSALSDIWAMVARTAYTQLKYSPFWLAACAAAMVLAFWIPVIASFGGDGITRGAGMTAFWSMVVSYLPTLRFYRMSPLWALAMPVIGTLFLLMTFTSALRYYRRERARWKGRVYAAS